MQRNRRTYQTYFNTNAKKLLEQLTIHLLQLKPQNPVNEMIAWLLPHAETPHRFTDQSNNHPTTSKTQQANDQMNEEELRNMIARKKINKKQRQSISAEAFGKLNQPKKFIPKLIDKEESDRNNLRKILKKSFMFASLEHNELEDVIGCMRKKVAQEGEYVIKQGDQGNQLYVVQRGALTCTKRISPSDMQDTFLKYYTPGDSFGQLSLLYNVPRQASVLANEYSQLWGLDRETFNNIVRERMVDKKSHIKSLVQKVRLFEGMHDTEIEKVVDSVKVVNYDTNEYVCHEGDQGQCLYIVDYGSLIAEKIIEGKIKTVFEYKSGMYFGEIALVYNTTRKASVKCLQNSRLYTVGKNQFGRLVGLNEQLLKDFSKYEGMKLN